MVEALSVKTTTWAVSGLVRLGWTFNPSRSSRNSIFQQNKQDKTKDQHDINECFCLDLWFSRQVFINTLPPEIMAGETNHLRVDFQLFSVPAKEVRHQRTTRSTVSESGGKNVAQAKGCGNSCPSCPSQAGGGKGCSYCWRCVGTFQVDVSKPFQTGGKHWTNQLLKNGPPCFVTSRCL